MGWVVDMANLPGEFSTHRHEAEFWERLGRAVATFGFLEKVLGKAIFCFTATRPFDAGEVDEAYREWLPKLERALTETLGGLIARFGTAVRDHPKADVPHLEEILDGLRAASRIRNDLCHGSWAPPDRAGASMPLFVERGGNVFDTAVDCAHLDRVRRHVAELSCTLISSVTSMGWQFPGSGGPGKPISGA